MQSSNLTAEERDATNRRLRDTLTGWTDLEAKWRGHIYDGSKGNLQSKDRPKRIEDLDMKQDIAIERAKVSRELLDLYLQTSGNADQGHVKELEDKLPGLSWKNQKEKQREAGSSAPEPGSGDAGPN